MADTPPETTADRRERYTGVRSRTKSLSVGDLRASNKTVKVPEMPIFEEKAAIIERMGRLIMVSNRLSVTVKRSPNGEYSFEPSSGGLATGLAGMMKTTEFWWYGWPGIEVPADEQDELRRQCVSEHRACPIFMTHQLSDRHYNGFSNEILWPLFHYHPQDINFDEDAWSAYQEANRIFAKTVAKDVRDGDLIWVQDYHLMLLPAMLREELERMEPKPRNVKIGFFLHTPFPSSEIYRILPVRSEILEGVLHSDLIGFHTYDYVRHFGSACSRLVRGAQSTARHIVYKNKAVLIGEFPIGIEPQVFLEGLDKPKIKQRIEALEESYKQWTVIVGVDRLDYIKGIQQKLFALDVFLGEHPEWIGKLKLVQVAVPSRQDVEEYQSLRTKIQQLVGYINGKYGTIEYQPVTFVHQSITQDELIALYAVSDVCLVTSTRDGMNLVSFEYIACQRDRHGVLILSEFAGAAGRLHGSLVVNPWSQDDLAKAIHEAVTMSDSAREQRYARMIHYVQNHTSQWWSETFIADLTRISEMAQKKQLKSRREGSQSLQQQVDVPEAVPEDVDSVTEETMTTTTAEKSPDDLDKTGQGRDEDSDSEDDALMMKPSPRGATASRS